MPQSLKTIELETGANPQFAIILLHGLGASANDFVPIIPELHLPAELPVRFIFPNAPVIAVTINGGYQMPAWYDILELSANSRKVDQQGINQTIDQIKQLIEQQIERGIASSHIFLAGFSQGGAIAYQTALIFDKDLAGVIALSTYLPDANWVKSHFNTLHQQLPIFAAHGIYDGVVSLSMGQHAAQVAEQLGCEVSFQQYPMEHQVCLQEIADISQWLVQHMTQIKAVNP